MDNLGNLNSSQKKRLITQQEPLFQVPDAGGGIGELYNAQSTYVQWTHLGVLEHLEPSLGNQPIYSLVQGQMVSFTKHEILNAIPLQDIPKDEPSFSIKVKEMPTGSPALKVLCPNLSNYDFNINFVKLRLLNVNFVKLWLLKKKELVLVFLFFKHNIAPSSTTRIILKRCSATKLDLTEVPIWCSQYHTHLHIPVYGGRPKNVYNIQGCKSPVNSVVPHHPDLSEPRSYFIVSWHRDLPHGGLNWYKCEKEHECKNGSMVAPDF